MKKWLWWGSQQLHLLVVVVDEGIARPSEMKIKRKEVEVVDLGDEEEDDDAGAEAEAEVRITGVSETAKRQKLNHSNDGELTKGYRDGARDGEASGSGTMEMVGRILEGRRRKSTRPLPARIGTQTVDLIALYSRVQSLGGYSKVTEAKLWPSISGALGLGLDCGPAVKLVFVKYLKALEADKHASARVELGKHLYPAHAHSVRENQNQNQNQNGDATQRKKENDGALVTDAEVIGDLRGREQERNQLECRQSSTREDGTTTHASVEHRDGNPSRNLTRVDEEEGSGVSEDWYEGAREENVQQQREALRGMVEWIRQAALCPVGTAVAFGEGSSTDEGWVSQCRMLTAKVRSVLWKEPRGGEGSSHQAKQSPTFYYDDLIRPDAQALEKLRATRDRLESYGFQPPKFHHQDSCAPAGAGQRSGRHNSVNYNESAFARHNQQRKRIPVGPEFQAEVPPWVPPEERLRDAAAAGDGGGPSNSGGGDGEGKNHRNRWLGVRVWPPAGAAVENSSLRPVGRGRPSSCDCQEPGSIQCVRVHIAAARARLRRELGPAFVDLGLDQMGECIADQYWTREEERTFRLVARTHLASKGSNFWDYLPDALPHKSRMELNSYYFNVFVLRRRALQNRLRDAKIDSDDDESELPGESEESEYGSTDEEEEEEEVDDEDDDDDGAIFSNAAGDAGIERVPGAFPLKVPNDAGMGKLKSLPDFNFSPPEEVSHSRVEIGGPEDEEDKEEEDDEEEGNHIAPDDSHAVLGWDDKPLESESLVRGGGNGRHWGEHPNWDGRAHEEEVNSGLVVGEALPSRQLSPLKEDVRQGPALGDLWSQNMEMAPTREKDKLLSTNGMILELFGDDDSECAGTVDSD